MDQPQHQVFGADRHSYRYMSYPFQKQPLQLLYPGRYLTPQDYYTAENIPNEDMDGLDMTRETNAILSHVARMETEALSRHLGGKHPVVAHPAVEPEAPNEDPALTSLNIHDTTGLSPNLDEVPSPYDHLNAMEKEGRQEVHQLRQELKDNARPPRKYPDNILPRYNWGGEYEKEYFSPSEDSNVSTYTTIENGVCTVYTCNNANKTCSQVTCDKKCDNCGNPSQCDYSASCSGETNTSAESSPNNMWIALIIIFIIAVVAIVLLIYGMHRNKKISNALKPKNYNIVSPQFLPSGTYPDV